MKLIIRTFFATLAIAALLIVAAPYVHAKQGGVKLAKTENSRMDTWVIHQDVMTRYTYELDHPTDPNIDTWDVYDGNFPFAGDCEDFAFTMQAMIGAGSVYAAYLPDENYVEGELMTPNHQVFVYAGMVWELNGMALNIQRYEQDGRMIYFRFGDLTPELK